MLFQVGGQGARPTFFEMSAAQQLPSSLRAALTYSLGVLALRRPFLHKILDYEDEFFALLLLVLETHSLRTTDASFAESLYGLRRRAVKIRVKKDSSPADMSDQIQHSGLEKRQKVLSVVFMVVLPYLKSKLHAIYNKEREATLQASLWGHGDDRYEYGENYDGEGSSLVSGRSLDRNAPIREHLMKRIQKIVGACYPWLHAGSEGVSFAYQLLYLLDATGFYSLALHALQIHVCRATAQELMDTSSRISRIRSHERERLRGPPWLKALQGALLSCTYTVLDYAQTGLIAAVFFFKVAKDGIPLPLDRKICPLCSQKRANPSVLTASGFVFCYACIFKYVSQYKRCPITLMPANVDHIRRLFHDI
ncbi:Pex, N-terminal [Dillenia turbinata]|uniref:Peroxisome biogenesis protein 12 n=1 Tax=Dillenia turbinata TaxID=194707 RepID=A0AAN8URF8_9MAGN